MTIDNKQMALLKNRLQMPLIVLDMLASSKAPNAEENYALHEMLGNFNAGEALLCSAFTMKEVAGFKADMSTDLSFLHMECDRIIERYSARDALSDENPELWFETEVNMMDIMYEDMEDFLELIELCHMSYEITNPRIAKILSIITAQLQSHMMIIDEVISMQQNINIPVQQGITVIAEDNIIMFPS